MRKSIGFAAVFTMVTVGVAAPAEAARDVFRFHNVNAFGTFSTSDERTFTSRSVITAGKFVVDGTNVINGLRSSSGMVQTAKEKTVSEDCPLPG